MLNYNRIAFNKQHYRKYWTIISQLTVRFLNSFQSLYSMCTFQVCKWHFAALFAINSESSFFFFAHLEQKKKRIFLMKFYCTNVNDSLTGWFFFLSCYLNLFSLLNEMIFPSVKYHEHAMLSNTFFFQRLLFKCRCAFLRIGNDFSFLMAMVHLVLLNDILNLWKFHTPNQ